MNTITRTLKAIGARRAGVFDAPVLVAFGPLSTNTETDVLRIKTECLEKLGYTVGKRDPRLNTRFAGAFMVVEQHDESELPTEDGSNGPWCIVGNDLKWLVEEAFDIAADIYGS